MGTPFDEDTLSLLRRFERENKIDLGLNRKKMGNETIEGNKLIAEFMNLPDGAFKYIENDCEFHTSWDWIVPAIRKVRSVSFSSQELVNYAKLLAVMQSLDINNTWKELIYCINSLNTQQNG